MIKQTKTKYCDNFFYYENDNVIGKSIENYGEYAQRELDFLTSLLNKNCVVYDIGGNIGYHAIAFASVAKYVYTFEPNLQNFDLLLKNIKDYNNICPINAAVGDIGTVLNIEEFNITQQSNYGNVKVGNGNKQVISLKLDNFLMPQPNLVKIDVEGFEYKVIQGMKNIIELCSPWIYFEAHETVELPEIIKFLNDLKYNMYWCEVKNFNENNFLKNTNNVFANSATISILAVPNYLEKLPLDKVLDENDTYEKLSMRIKQRIKDN